MPATLAATSLTTTSGTPATGIATLTKPASDTLSLFQVSGTYGTVTDIFSGTYDGTLWFPINAVNVNDGSPASGTITLTDNSTRLFSIWSPGLTGVRLEVTAIASGTLVVSAQSNSYVGLPNNPTSAVSTYGNMTASGTITGTSASASALAVGLAGATNPALKVDASTASSATGLQVKSAAAAGGLAMSVISSGTNENLKLDAKGSGTLTLGGTSTGNMLIGGGGGIAVLTGTLTAGGLLTCALQVATSGPLVYSGSGAPTISAAVKGSIYLRSDGSSTSTRMYVATDTVGTWTAVTTVA